MEIDENQELVQVLGLGGTNPFSLQKGVAEVENLLIRLYSREVPSSSKLLKLKIVEEPLNPAAVKFILQDTDLLVRGVVTVLDQYLKTKGCLEKEVLTRTLRVLNQCLAAMDRDEVVKLEANISRSSRLDLLHNLMLLSKPSLEPTSHGLVRLLAQVLKEKGDGALLLGDCAFSLEQPEDIISDFRECLGLELRSQESSILRDVPAGFQLLRLHIQDKDGRETSVADKLMEQDVREELWRVEFHEKTKSSFAPGSCAEVQVARLFPSGHLLAYVGHEWRDRLAMLENSILLSLSGLRPPNPESVKPGSVVLVELRLVELDSKPSIRVRSARAIVLCPASSRGTCRVYLPDYGVTGTVDINEVKEAPDLVQFGEPLLAFCRLQGVAPAPELQLIRETTQALDQLTHTTNVVALVSRPSLAALNTLTSLLSVKNMAIIERSVNILGKLCDTSTSLSLLNSCSGSALPASLEHLAPRLLNLLHANSTPPSLGERCASILFNILNKVKPGLMRQYISSVDKQLHSLLDKQSSKLSGIIEKILNLSRDGNLYKELYDRGANTTASRESRKKNSGTGNFTFTSILNSPKISRSKCFASQSRHIISQSGYNNSKSGHYSTQSGYNNLKSRNTSSQLAHSYSQPVKSASLPVHSTSQPVKSASLPVHSTSQPMHSTFQPMHSTFQSMHSTFQPMHPTFQPLHSTSQPAQSASQERKTPKSTTNGSSGHMFAPISGPAAGLSSCELTKEEASRFKRSISNSSRQLMQSVGDLLSREEILETLGIEDSPGDLCHVISRYTESLLSSILSSEDSGPAAVATSLDAAAAVATGLDAVGSQGEIREIAPAGDTLTPVVERDIVPVETPPSPVVPVGILSCPVVPVGIPPCPVAPVGIPPSSMVAVGIPPCPVVPVGIPPSPVVPVGNPPSLVVPVGTPLLEHSDVKAPSVVGILRRGCVLTQRPGLEVEMVESLGTSLQEAGTLAVLISAMANTAGGTVFIGAKGKGLVCGQPLSRRRRDEFSQMLDLLSTELIYPKLSMFLTKMDFVPVESHSAGGREETQEEELFLIRIRVNKGNGQYYITHNIPGAETAIYMRKKKGPNHTYKVPSDEALRLIKVNNSSLVEEHSLLVD